MKEKIAANPREQGLSLSNASAKRESENNRGAAH